MRKRALLVLLCAITSLLPVFASVADIWTDDVKDNPSKLFFSSSSLFVAELNFKDSFLKSGNMPRSFQEPLFDFNVSVLGGVVALNLGATTSMKIKDNEPYSYVSTKQRYFDVLVAYGYKYFSVGMNLSLSDEKQNDAEFNRDVPFFSFLGEVFFKYYTNVSSRVKTSLGLSLTLTDGNYFSFGVFATDMLVFTDTSAILNGESIYKSLNFGISAISPEYNKLDDLIPVRAKLSFDALKLFNDNKQFKILFNLSLVFLKDTSMDISNTLDFFTYKGEGFDINNKRFFMHSLALSFRNKYFMVELSTSLSPELYRNIDREFQMALKVKIFA